MVAHISELQPSKVQPLSCVQLFATPWTAGHQASLSITNSRRLVIELGMIHHFLYLTFLPWFYIDSCISPILICILVFI